jgi:catechol 2,3-dioxygenase-like lactoylglutathione lyase family enzyme
LETAIINLVNQFERGLISRRQLVQSLTLGVAALAAGSAARAAGEPAPAHKGFKATSVNHISYTVADYRRARDFYSELLGMAVSADDGKQCYLTFGDTAIIARNGKTPSAKPVIDHIAYTIDNWDTKAVEAELRRRGLNPKPDYDSFLIVDPDGYDVQIASKGLMQQPP